MCNHKYNIKMIFVVSERKIQYSMWKSAINQSIGWIKENEEYNDDFDGF